MKTHLLIGLGMLVSLTIATANAKPAAADSPVTQSRIVELTRGQPMLFEINRGQAEANVQFQARGQGYGISLAPGEAVLSLRAFPNKSEQAAGCSATVRMRLVGANLDAKLTGLDQQSAMVNYFRGNDPKQWHTQIPTFARVKAARVYPGVDLVYYGNQRQLEFDFVVAPGADPNQIALKFEGAEKVEINASGQLVLTTSGGQILQHKPVIYQEVDGVRHEISGGYVLQNKQQVGFQVASYDHTQPLVIDPTLSYSTYLGGSDADQGNDITVDAAGNVYVTGETRSANFPTASPYQATKAAGRDAFVTKFNPAGAVIFSTYFGGSGGNGTTGSGIALDSSGNIYITGFTDSTGLPVTPGAFRTAATAFGYGYCTKFNPTGSALVYCTYLDGYGHGIAVDANNFAYIAGQTATVAVPMTNGFQTVYGGQSGSGNGDGYVVKLNATGTAQLYSTYIGGSSD